MKYRKSMIILVLAVFIFGAASVCANDVATVGEIDSAVELTQEDADELVSAEENELIGQTGNGEVVGDMDNGTFQALENKIAAGYGSTITLDRNYECEDDFNIDGIEISQSITIDGQGHKIDAKCKSRIFNIVCDNVTIKNITFTNGYFARYSGGAIRLYANDCSILDCVFVNNFASDSGAIRMVGNNNDISGCVFENNSCYSTGSAMTLSEGSNNTISDCVFSNNTGKSGTFYVYADNTSVSGCVFADNYANDAGGALYWMVIGGTISDCIFVNNFVPYNPSFGFGGAILLDTRQSSKVIVSRCIFINNTAFYGGAIDTVSLDGSAEVSECIFINNKVSGSGPPTIFVSPSNVHVITDYSWFGNNATDYTDWPTIATDVQYDYRLFLNATVDSNIPDLGTSEIIFKLYLYNSSSGKVSDYDNAPFEYLNFTITSTNGFVDKNSVKLGEKVTYTATNKGIGTVTVSLDNVQYTIELDNIMLNPMLSVPSQETYFTQNATIALNYNSNATGKVNITLKGRNGNSYTFTGLDLNATVSLGTINVDEYNVTVTYSGDDNFTNATAIGTLKVDKANSTLTVKDITFDYNGIGSTEISFTGAYAVNASVVGQPNAVVKVEGTKISVSGLDVGTYTLTVTTITDAYYNPVTVNAKITVNKATPKLTAKAKTFKTTTKTKKYTVTLKDNTGKALKNAKVTLKVNGKTYKAKTNSKGKATFKITKLTKKGTYKATITFKGDKNYKKVTKKTKIKVIVTFKTVSRGSKDKSTVKEIQQALKDKGYYLSYKGHYLMVDGKFESCTERSVKQFQHDKGLKVTGKVDEKTAKKLGII